MPWGPYFAAASCSRRGPACHWREAESLFSRSFGLLSSMCRCPGVALHRPLRAQHRSPGTIRRHSSAHAPASSQTVLSNRWQDRAWSSPASRVLAEHRGATADDLLLMRTQGLSAHYLRHGARRDGVGSAVLRCRRCRRFRDLFVLRRGFLVGHRNPWYPFHPTAPIQGLDHRSEEHTSELQSLRHLVCRLLLE